MDYKQCMLWLRYKTLNHSSIDGSSLTVDFYVRNVYFVCMFLIVLYSSGICSAEIWYCISGYFDPCRWDHYIVLKCWEPHIQRY